MVQPGLLSAIFVLIGVELLVLLYLQLTLSGDVIHLDSHLRMRDVILGVAEQRPAALTPVLWLNLLATTTLWIHFRGLIAKGGMRDFPVALTSLSAAFILTFLSHLISLFPLRFEPLVIQGMLIRSDSGRYELELNAGSGLAHLENCASWHSELDGATEAPR